MRLFIPTIVYKTNYRGYMKKYININSLSRFQLATGPHSTDKKREYKYMNAIIRDQNGPKPQTEPCFS